jgi:hypothetical protein
MKQMVRIARWRHCGLCSVVRIWFYYSDIAIGWIYIFETKLIVDLSEIISANIQVKFMNHHNLNSELIENNNY